MELASGIIRHKRRIVWAWLVIIPLALGATRSLQDRMVAFTRLEGSESAAVEDILVERFGSRTAESLVLVARGFPEDAFQPASGLLESFSAELTSVPGVQVVMTPENTPDPLLVGDESGSAVLLVGIDTRRARGDSIVAGVRQATQRFLSRIHTEFPAAASATLRTTGTAALSLDLRGVSSGEARRAELRALPFLLAVLLMAFRSLIAALVPLVLGGLAISVGLGVALILGSLGTPSLLLGSVASILGLALGIDYSLLMVTRFREALAEGLPPDQAALQAVSTAGRTILLSGSTVALGFAGLVLVPVGEIRSIGIGGLGVTAVAVALATTLLPAILCGIGTGIDRGRLRSSPLAGPADVWYRLGRLVTGHPFWALIVAGVPLIAVSLPAVHISLATPEEEWLPPAMESSVALADLAEVGRAGFAYVIPVVMDLSPAQGLEATDPWERVSRIGERLAADPRVAEVRSMATMASSFGLSTEEFVRFAPARVREQFLSTDETMARLDVIPAPDVPSPELASLVRWIRTIGDDSGERLTSRRVLLAGGVPAFQADYERAVTRAFPWVAALVIGSILLVLSLGFRSILIPLKATALNLLTVGAGFGTMVLVFQHGVGAGLFGLSDPISGVFPAVPILAFCIVFGLSMDYEVFLVSRVAEARRSHPGGSERGAIIEGLARTGRVITFAGTLMVVVFASFAFSEYLPAKLLGLCLAVAVLSDVTLVRLGVGPALLQIAGRWNWWHPWTGPLKAK